MNYRMRVNLKPDERIALVRHIFSRVVPHYDLLNRLLSLRRDVFWRRAAARRAHVFDTYRILDMACGTADLSLALSQRHPEARVFGIDFTIQMLERGRKKLVQNNFDRRIHLAAANALCLPFPDATFDTVTIAFGIRNIPDRRQALSEMRRILVPGGKALILEMSFPPWPIIRRMYDTYLNRMIPVLGRWLTPNPVAYQYMADSIMDFPSPEELRTEMETAGFVATGYHPLTHGITLISWGYKEKPE